MPRAENKLKGNIGESAILYEFVKRRIPVAIPFGDNERYDLIAEFDGKLNRIQVKYCGEETDNDGVVCPCASSYNHVTNGDAWQTYSEEVDYFCFWLPNDNLGLIVPMSEIGDKKSITFKRSPSKNGQKVRLVQDYTFDKKFSTICSVSLTG